MNICIIYGLKSVKPDVGLTIFSERRAARTILSYPKDFMMIRGFPISIIRLISSTRATCSRERPSIAGKCSKVAGVSIWARGTRITCRFFAYFSTELFLFKNNDAVANDIVPPKLEKPKSPQSLFDLNTAGKEELMSINGIGPVLSARIIAGRPYRSVDDLLKVKGIGPKRLENIRPYFVVDKK